MTEKLFIEDSYQTKTTATVVAISNDDTPYIELDKTLFYATSGGQPGDTGVIESESGTVLKVIDTRYASDRMTIRHYVSPESDLSHFKTGSIVNIEIDWKRRHRLMRMHTSMHLLCALIPFPVTGGGVGEEESRVEFDMETSDFDKQELSQKLNEFVEQGLSVESSWITDQELDENPELIRTMSVKPPRGVGKVRMLNIGDKLDYQPCGGTHVKSTTEIGQLAVTKIKSKGKQNKRVSLALVSP